MKRRFYLILSLLTITGILFADIEAETPGYLYLSPAADEISIQPGILYHPVFSLFPIVDISIPFAGNYYLSGALGAGEGDSGSGNLSTFQVGLGYVGYLKLEEDLSYIGSVSVRSFRTDEFTSMILSAGLMFRKDIGKVRACVGGAFDYEQRNESNMNIENRTYTLHLDVMLLTPYGNIIVRGKPGNITAGLSWTLKLDN